MGIEYKGFFDYDTMMKQWDSWRKYIAEGGGGTWPRDAFEALLDYFEERLASQQADPAGGNEPCDHDWQHFPCKPAGFTKCSKCGLRR